MSEPGAQGLAESVLDIARRAGEAILEVYASQDAGMRLKADDSPLTTADLRSHRLIESALRSLTPEVPVLSEESRQVPYSIRCGWRRYWLVDPLDGTKEFLSRNGEFTVNIALIEDHVPALGVVHVPVGSTTYWGIPRSGAWRRRPGEDLQPIHTARQESSPVRVVGSKSHRGDSLDGFLARLGPHELLPVGSSLKFCMVAEGRADVYPRLGPTSEWDTAAAQAIVLGAGGGVVELDGRPLAYNRKTSLLNPHFVAFGNESRDWLALLSGIPA